MAKIAILYDSTEGQTAKIARFMAEVARENAHTAAINDIHALPTGFSLGDYDAVILGAPIRAGRHERRVASFVEHNLEFLQAMPSAFFSVSLSAAGKTERQQRNAWECLGRFLQRTSWRPQAKTIIAGALLYRKYGFFKRLLMRWIAWYEGGDTDTSRNFEYTDWNQVRAFVEEFCGALSGGPRRLLQTT